MLVWRGWFLLGSQSLLAAVLRVFCCLFFVGFAFALRPGRLLVRCSFPVGSWLVYGWFIGGSLVVHWWFTGGSWLVHCWFMGGSLLVHCWFMVGSFVVRCGALLAHCWFTRVYGLWRKPLQPNLKPADSLRPRVTRATVLWCPCLGSLIASLRQVLETWSPIFSAGGKRSVSDLLSICLHSQGPSVVQLASETLIE